MQTEIRQWCVTESHGQKLFGILHLPVVSTKSPLVVLMHGYASSKQGVNRNYIKLAQRYCQKGIAVLRFDFRGSGDSEGDLSSLSFSDLIKDAKAMLRYAQEIEQIDTDRIGVYGSSLGGALAVLALSEMPVAKALALWAPVASGKLWLKDFIFNNPLALLNQVKGFKKATRGITISKAFKSEFKEMKAYKKVGDLNSVALLHMHGNKDRTISLAHQRAYKKEAMGKIKNAEFELFPKIPHSLKKEEHMERVIQFSLDWFQEHL